MINVSILNDYMVPEEVDVITPHVAWLIGFDVKENHGRYLSSVDNKRKFESMEIKFEKTDIWSHVPTVTSFELDVVYKRGSSEAKFELLISSY